VAEIRVADEQGRDVSQPVPALPLEAGKPFDFPAERESLRKLYAMGDYSDIRVTAVSGAGGLRVNFIVTPNYYNNVIRIEGLKEPPTAPAALAAMRLGLGEPFRESSLKDGVDRLQATLKDNGLYLAKIQPVLAPHDDTRQMDVVVNVDPGPRARAGTITLKNQTPYPDRELVRRSKISAKKMVTALQLSRAGDRVKKFLVNQGYLGASAVIVPGAYDPPTNRVPLAYDVTAGPRVRIEINNAHLSHGAQRKLLPIYAEGAVDEDLLQEGRRNLRDYYQREGYFNADVQVTSRQDDEHNERVIVYDISRGDRFRLSGVSFTGNKYFASGLLLRRLSLEPASFASRGHFSQTLVRNDTESIRALYTSNGFRDAQVNASLDDNYHGKKDDLYVTFQIVEGSQTRVANLVIEGNRSISTDTLLAVSGSTEGQAYSESAVASDRNNILAMYYDDGFPEARFTNDVQPGKTLNEVSLAYHISEGPQIEVARVLLTGYQFTRPGIIARQVQVKAGEPLSQADVVVSERRLYSLAVFNRVQIAPQNPDGGDPSKVIVVDTEEGSRYTIGYGFGFEVQRLPGATTVASSPGTTGTGTANPSGTTIGASPRGIFSIARSNMFGRAQTLSFNARASTLEYRSVLTLTANNFLANRALSFQLTGFADKSQDVDTFTSTRFEGSMQIIDTVTPSSSLQFQYFYRRVEASNLNQTISPEQIPLLSQPTLVSGFGVTYARDHRDNPGDAAHGNFNTADVSFASTSLGSSANYFRGSFQNSTFTSFGRAFVFARSTRFGIEQPYGQTVEGNSVFSPTQCNSATITSAEQIIPLPERFFAGGGTSLRGFGLNQAGPRDPCTGFPIGGLALLTFNQELHFPMRLPFIGNRLGGTLLYDAGNVFTDVNRISLAWKPSSTTDLNYFSHTIGFGVRYPTPIGPVRVDLGYQLNPANYQGENSTTHAPQTFGLPHFQFFFNIGPVF